MLTSINSTKPQAPLSIADAAAKLARNELTVIDVREMAELRSSGKAKGAIHVPLALLALKCDPRAPDCVIDGSKAVAVYCAAGGRASMAAMTLRQLGYDEVYNLGGLGDWINGGGQVERI